MFVRRFKLKKAFLTIFLIITLVGNTYTVYASDSMNKSEIPLKSPYTGPKYLADPQVILQGGDTIADATIINGLPHHSIGTTVGYTHDYDEGCPEIR